MEKLKLCISGGRVASALNQGILSALEKDGSMNGGAFQAGNPGSNECRLIPPLPLLGLCQVKPRCEWNR
jgi:hypothetical protein